jgi:antitoxin CptB
MLDARRKRVLFRSLHRGTKEADWLLGGFAEAVVAELDEADLAGLERLQDVPDNDLVDWVLGRRPVDPAFDDALFRRLKAFAHEQKAAR